MTQQTVNIRLPAELHRRLAALAVEGILGRTIEEVVVHLTRNALHRDWLFQSTAPEWPRPPGQQVSPEGRLASKTQAADEALPPSKRLLRLPEVSRLIGLGRSSIYRLVHRRMFPAPKKLGTRSVAWLQSDVESWIDARDKVS